MIETATFAGGCFWCTEAIFWRLKGILSVVPGYTGGTVKNPTYEQVCNGSTGHAEAIQITFDPISIPYRVLLDVFWATHNPTTFDRQGYDTGPVYRSIIFYHSDVQKIQAEQSKKMLENAHIYSNPVVTELLPATEFYVAEDYHKNYYEKYQFEPYCQVIIDPKIKKLLEQFAPLVKDEYKSRSL